MTNLIKFDGFDNSEIRVTEDGRYSVYDVIKFCGQKNPWQPWKRLCEQYPELLTKCNNYKFSGKGGISKPTPVASKEACEEIMKAIGGHLGKSPITSDKFYPRTEVQVIQVLSQAFSDCEPCTQFYCSGYRIDLYLAVPRIAVECDEYGHKDYSEEEEQKRERIIKPALGCSFVRFDPYSPEFNIGTIIRQIRELV